MVSEKTSSDMTNSFPSVEETKGASSNKASTNEASTNETPTNGTLPNETPTTHTTNPSRPPQSVADLPPAALDLAAKLFDLARSGTTPTLHHYLTAGIPPNLTNATGDTLLMLAAYHGHAATTQMLLDCGADPNVLNGRGQSPLAGAVFKGFEDVVGVLVGAGADVGAGQPNAVECARMFRREGVLELFKERGVGGDREGGGEVGGGGGE